MKEFLFTLLQAIIIAAVPVITTYLCKFLSARKIEVSQKITDETARKLFVEAVDAVAVAVVSTNQTYVDTLKKSGQFTPDNQKEAFNRAYQTALTTMTKEAKDFIEVSYGSLSEWLTARIEAQVNAEKV